eukprot:TRINITY_DN12028_c0_g1_i3.p1 TRINITY_DN12028_c0_g1~~TRINITY_DN12028_c0_g1_i3.p1  ORF type:complete len:192 (+),score=43.90 TRINITY_DN12028_c0_g1_i3:82-657(+)
MIRRPPRSTLSSSSAASDVYKRQEYGRTKQHCMREGSPLRRQLEGAPTSSSPRNSTSPLRAHDAEGMSLKDVYLEEEVKTLRKQLKQEERLRHRAEVRATNLEKQLSIIQKQCSLVITRNVLLSPYRWLSLWGFTRWAGFVSGAKEGDGGPSTRVKQAPPSAEMMTALRLARDELQALHGNIGSMFQKNAY